jgi:hypothetical protein
LRDQSDLYEEAAFEKGLQHRKGLKQGAKCARGERNGAGELKALMRTGRASCVGKDETPPVARAESTNGQQ